ncbi:glycosyltransferase family 2 protein [Puniceicoccus vermicola]|uniref:Glycosyltransferase family 2 protein n=1 Tax=Puniceicoccus vermicola TaxID=388746 RepID=A0A7X1AWH9_9BACT|nr:glycosyltransferase family 2 protein [Puniceicoccus vermicola]MBC2601127.1 glycosyltransferase family 2 protein [Puniceicoccus vermicola]
MSKERISVVIPVFNEEGNLPDLRRKIIEALEAVGADWECILVNDGSSDGSSDLLDQFQAEDPRFRAIHFRRNYGQTAAMQAGFDSAEGDIIIPMDGDLQNDPVDIRRMLDKLNEGYDVISGWRKDRKDKKISRVFVSRIANRVISWISGVRLHDYGCSLKAYRREVLKGVRLYGEMHRFIPIYASWQGAKVAEISVSHHPRVHGKSSYGLERVFKVILDLMVVKFLHKYSHKPMYLFGGFGLVFFFFGFVSFIWMSSLKLFADIQLTGTPLPLLTVFMGSLGVMSILLGLLAELGTRTYFESQGKRTYIIRETKEGETIVRERTDLPNV